jgi:threonine dehydratase
MRAAADAPALPAPADVAAARARIAARVRVTPLEPSPRLTARAGVPVHLKLECWQATRSFKVRGAFNAALRRVEAGLGRSGLVTSSAGNHGQALALAARTLGLPLRVYVPAAAPWTKKARIRALGAALDDSAADYDAAEALARAEAARSGADFVHPCSDRDVAAGQGTLALELLDALPDVRSIVVPVGGGGLAAGVLAAVAGRDVRVIGVQSTATRAMFEALRAGSVVPVPDRPSLADGLAGDVDAFGLAVAERLHGGVRLVTEQAVAAAIVAHAAEDGLLVEGAGAVPAAAVATLDLALDGPTALVVTGGNIDAGRLAGLLADRSAH